jgi:hypothetical protein
MNRQFKIKQERQCTHDVTLRLGRVTNVGTVKYEALRILSVCL